jgi:asparagine synthase (glutamine-hydrolysing)
MKKLNYDVTGYVVGVKSAADITSAEKAAKEIGISLKKIIIDEKDIGKVKETLLKILGNIGNMEISFNMPWFFVCKNAQETRIINGNGPDELLAGYHRYKSMEKEEAESAMRDDTEKLINKEYMQQKSIAEYFKKKIEMPYINQEFVKFCQTLDYDMKINEKGNKYILRKSAEKFLGEIAWKKKKAAQYGSGVMNVLKKLARN